MLELPEPSADARAASEALAERIRARITERGGWIGFDEYMEQALYAPALGYYSGGSTKLGRAGDFVTAPELGGFLARALAETFTPVLARCRATPAVLELGAGTGALAGQLIDALARAGAPEVAYRILEPSAELAERQRRELAGRGVEWLGTLPAEPFDGIVVANEVADALPVARFVKRGGRALPLGVGLGPDGFEWAVGESEPRTTAAVAAIERSLGRTLPDGYCSEWCPALPAWIESLAGVLGRGAVALVDYGLTRREYYHPERADGTLICHYRHRAHGDPFVYPGLQDITAWVDYTAAADAARRAGLDVAGFTTQSLFVVETLAALADNPVADASVEQLAALRTLVLPGEMGERFKVLWLTRGIDAAPLPGRDMRARLEPEHEPG